MRTKILVFSILCFVFIINCSSGGTVGIELPMGTHLEDTKAGSFLKPLQINYNGNFSFTERIQKALMHNAVLEDQYLEDKNKILVKRWRFLDIRDGRPFILIEKTSSKGWTSFIYLLGSNGVPYTTLIGDKAKNLEPNRKYEGSVYISSKTDDARIILFGLGNYCTSMTILEGS